MHTPEPSSWGEVILADGGPLSQRTLPCGLSLSFLQAHTASSPIVPTHSWGQVETGHCSFQSISLCGCPSRSPHLSWVHSALPYWPGLPPFPERLLLSPWASPSVGVWGLSSAGQQHLGQGVSSCGHPGDVRAHGEGTVPRASSAPRPAGRVGTGLGDGRASP